MVVGQTGMPVKKVFGHKMGEFSAHLTNEAADYHDRNYWTVPSGQLNPAGRDAMLGEGGKFATWGGAIRDRPKRIPNLPVVTDDFQQYVEDEEVRRAKAHNLQGFTSLWTNFNMTTDDKTKRCRKSIIACTKVDNFKTIVTPDMTLSAGSLTPRLFADALIDLASITGPYGNGMFKLDDGRFLIAPYMSGITNSTSWKTAAWWSEMFGYLTAVGLGFAMVPMPNGLSTALMDFFDAIPQTVGYNVFGASHPGAVAGYSGVGTSIRARPGNKFYMAPLSAWDSRIAWGQFWENGGFQLLEATGQQLVDTATGPGDMVQLKTWSDYTEAAVFADTELNLGNAAMNILNKWWLPKWRTGANPTPTVDSVHIAHRRHKMNPVLRLNAPLPINVATTSISVPTSGIGSVTAEMRALLTTNAKISFWTGAQLTVAAQPALNSPTVQIQSYTPTYAADADGKISNGKSYSDGWRVGEALSVANWTYTPTAPATYRPATNGRYLRQDMNNSAPDTMNILDVVTILTGTADVTVVDGDGTATYSAPAGYFRWSKSLAIGPAPKVTVSRTGNPQVSVTSPSPVYAAPYVQDPHYITAMAENPPTIVVQPTITARLDRHQFANGLESEWLASNPVLRPGEPGWVNNFQELRVGDGSRSWKNLLGINELIRPKSGSWVHASNVTGNAATGTPTVGTLYLLPLYGGFDIQALGLFANAAQVLGTGGVITNTLGIYDSDADGYPDLAGGPLAQGTISAATTGMKSAPVSVSSGGYRKWLAFLQTTSGTITTAPTFSCVGNTLPMLSTNQPGGTVQKYLQVAGMTALPTTAQTIISGSGAGCPMLQIQVT